MADPKSDVEYLMNETIAFADQMLSEHGEFFPYGAAMTPNGEIVSVAGYEGSEQPPSQKLIDLLKGGFRQSASNGEYKATVIFYDVRVSMPDGVGKSDAIAAALDHREDYSVVVFFPYKLDGGEIQYGELFAQAGENAVFGQ